MKLFKFALRMYRHNQKLKLELKEAYTLMQEQRELMREQRLMTERQRLEIAKLRRLF